jgi:PD-(D/E)XK nuclease superfamily
MINVRLKKLPFETILGWSISRWNVFVKCKRQYYYQYYAANFDKEFNQLEVKSLKSLTRIPLEIGNITHELVRDILLRLYKTPKPFDNDKFFDFVSTKSAEIVATKEFAEVYYRERDEIESNLDIFPKVLESLTNFCNSERFEWIIENGLKNKDKWIVDPREFYGDCWISKMKALCKVDFYTPCDEDHYVFDWKTGSEAKLYPHDRYDQHSRQLRGYAAWTNFQFEADYSHIKPIIAYLFPVYKEREITLNEHDIEEFGDSVKTQSEEMYGFCSNIENNLPKQKEIFEMTENLRVCQDCNFRKFCDRTTL